MANGIGIIVKKEDKEYLDSLKEHPRDTYGDIVHKLIECWKIYGTEMKIAKPDKEFVTPDPDSPTGIKEEPTIPVEDTGEKFPSEDTVI